MHPVITANRHEPPARRAEALLSEMTLEEKIGQMIQIGPAPHAAEAARAGRIGSCLHTMGERLNEIQAAAAESRLGIPVLFGIDAIHGHGLWKNATIFPTQLGLSQSWNPALLETIGRITAAEVRATGPHWTFSPQFDLCRDIRWGRLGETFGEDPLLIGELGAALSRGYQGTSLADDDTVLACAKHYAGYGETIGARDASESETSRRKMRMWFLPPFERAVRDGCGSIMIAYQTIDGTPATFDQWLLDEVLRGEWGFEGFTVTDWNNVGRTTCEQFICHDHTEAMVRAVKAGMDMVMATEQSFEALLAAVQTRQLDEALINRAAARILIKKFELGLFDRLENRQAQPEKIKSLVGCEKHRTIALQAARESLVLLKNESDLLPLDRSQIKSAAVIGPNADDIFGQLGGWIIGSAQQEYENSMHDRSRIITVLDGIRKLFPDIDVHYEQGCRCMDPDTCRQADFFIKNQPEGYLNPVENGIEKAVAASKRADVTIAVVGDTQSQIGECCDRADMRLGDEQEELLHALAATGKPLIVVLMMSKPHIITNWYDRANAVIFAGNPGQDGGEAIAELIAGSFNPSGKLTYSWPRSLGQQPVNYNQLPGWHVNSYMDAQRDPLFPFGFGLSFTTYKYSNLELARSELQIGETLQAAVDVENNGPRDGIEIVQFYIRDIISSALTPVRELKTWRRIALKAGEKQTVRVEIPCRELSFIDANGHRVVEPGDFELFAGPSSHPETLVNASFRVRP